MFTLKIHTVDTPQPFYTHSRTTATTNSAAANGPNPIISELRGIAHLFRSLPTSSSSSSSTPTFPLSNPLSRSTTLFVVAVPNYLSPDDFLLFCGSQVDYFSELIFLRNDGMEDRYSVIIKLVDWAGSDGFYCNFNGKRFQPSEAEVCHIYFIQSVDYSELAEIASAPPTGFAELPTCPICLERLDQDTSAIHATLCDHSFRCSCVSKWTYLSCQVCRLCQQQDEKPKCAVCGTIENLCVCLICGFVGCGRYEKGHAIRHWNDTQHCYSLELEKQQIWDYVGDKYVHRLNQSEIDVKSVATNFHFSSDDGGFGTCTNEEYSEVGGALLSSKIEATVDEYNHLLASQTANQRQHYESLLAEARSRMEASTRAADIDGISMMQKVQDRIEETIQETKIVADMNEELLKNQEVLRKRHEDIKEREISSLKSRDEKILDLEEQIRDLKVYIEAQRTVASMTASDGVRGGTLLPVQSNQSPSSNSKRRTKSGRRRN